MKTKVLKVQGKSMSPYICSGDLLFIDSKITPKVGDLVFLKREKSNQFIVHRLIQEKKTKGDRVKNFDQIAWQDIQVVGTVIGKLEKHKTIFFKHPITQRTHQLQAKLSSLNTYENKFMAKLSVALLIITGSALRTFQKLNFKDGI